MGPTCNRPPSSIHAIEPPSNGLAGAEDAMQFLIDLHKAGVTPPVGSVDWQGQFDLFKAGKIAIYRGETPD
jgi:hypothetical protein